LLDTDELKQWVERVGRDRWGNLRAASNRTAIAKLLSVRHEHEPKDLVWFLQNLDRLSARLKVSKSSATTYASRARITIREFYDAMNEVYVLPKVHEYRKLTVKEQIADALAAVGRWPDLRKYLLEPLVKAIKEIEKDQPGWPKDETPDPPSPK
jgi:hypothetical protein